MAQTNGYPSEADINAFLTARGLELVGENNASFLLEFKTFVYGILNAFDWAGALGVWLPSATTFNVRGGEYMYGGVIKTYTAGAAINPTDNDTTYVWMAADNTVGSDIDGDGWPAADHIKLAEIDVDGDGVITDIRDLRGQTFLRDRLTGLAVGNAGANGGITFILKAALAAGSTVQIHNANAPFKYRVLDVWSVATSADGGTWKLTNGTNDITNAVTVTGTDKTINRAGTIDNAYHEIAASGSLSVVGDGANADVEVYILCARVA